MRTDADHGLIAEAAAKERQRLPERIAGTR
jgi:hypothetical protein